MWESRNCARIAPKIFTVLTIVFWLLQSSPTICAEPLANQAPANTYASAAPTEVRKLEVGKPIERELKGGESHTYEITLEAGQYFNAVIEQRGIDVVVQVIAPDGKQVVEVDSPNGDKGDEPVMLISEAEGVYRVNVKSLENNAPVGKYQIRITELRAATEADRALIEKNRVLDEATKLADEAESLSRKGKYDAALPLAERALAIREKAQGAEHPDIAAALNRLALLFQTKSDYAKAEPLLIRALAIREKALGAEHPDTAISLNSLAGLYYFKGDYAKAEPLHTRALAIREKALGAEHPDIAAALNHLASLYHSKGNYAKAEPLYIRALTISEKALGAEHPSTARLLNNLALLYQAKGDYTKAEPLYLGALATSEKALGAEHSDTAQALNNLAMLYQAKGDYAKAEPLHLRALAIREKALGAQHPDIALSLTNLAALYNSKGDYVKAEPLLLRALAIREKTLGTQHPSTTFSLNSLAGLYNAKGDYAKAEPLYIRALAIREKALGAEHPSTASSLNNLAALYNVKGDYAKAEPLHLRALAIREKALGAQHPDIALSLTNLAALYNSKGDYVKAEPLLLRALAIREKTLGTQHPSTTFSLNSLAGLYNAKGDYTKAIAFQMRANETDERDLVRNLATGSERQKIVYLNRNSLDTDVTLSLHIQAVPTNLDIRRAALTRLLRRKGRALDAMTDAIAVLRRRASPDDQALLDQLAETRSQHSNLVNKGAGSDRVEQYREKLKALEDLEEQLENNISGRSLELRAQLLPISFEAVQKTIPTDAALLEFAAYRPYDAKAKKFGASRYVAYLLTNQGEIAHADLGEAEPIDKIVANWRQVLRQNMSDIERNVKPLARQLDEKIMRPVRLLLGDKRRLLVSPDGALNLIPFDALVDEKGRYLVENYSISYLTSGRDLLRLQTPKQSKQAALLFAAPDFDKSAEITKANVSDDATNMQRIDEAQDGKRGITPRVNSRLGPKLGSVQLQPFAGLPGSAKEGKKLKKLLKGSTMLTAAEATEAALKGASSPSILHISTHGGFLENEPKPEPNQTRGLLIRPAGTDELNEHLPPSVNLGNPLLRSGLFFAGANTGKSGDNDGVLMALEAAGLDLYGTKLVILSACDTGVGEVKNGDGVYGLRRAFVLAGAETQVMSLWPVSDEGTRELMVAYYKRLKAGEGRSVALRRVQLKMLASKNRNHPFYWASFILSGEWANLDGKR